MKKLLFTLLLIASYCGLQAQGNSPKLVVGIVVDQMRQEYLLRFEAKFGDKGFKRLMNEGFVARNNHYNYIPTYTGPGHASIYTGTTPRYHGIIGNNWYSKILGREVYCAGDTLPNNVGGSAQAGKISPRNLQVTTITDELKLTTNFRAKVIGISMKDRGSVLPAGHTPDGAFWYDSKTGEFMTSDYYMPELPKWVDKFNKKKLIDQYSNQVWNTLLPIDKYTESTADDTPYEGGFKGKDTPTFPYNLEELRKQNGPYGLILTTPFGNSLLADLAKAAIEGENMGKGDFTDFLAVSFSCTDYVGHNFGPNSIELEDTYLRLDQTIADLLDYLDKQVGKGNYTVFLTADHAVVANPGFLTDHNLPGGFIDGDRARAIGGKALIAKYGTTDFIETLTNDQIYLNHEAILASGNSVEEVQRFIAEALMEVPEITETFTATDLSRIDYTDPMRKTLQNGFNRKLSGDVLMLYKSGYLNGKPGNTGTSHGTGYTYDTNVPLIFYGAGIKKGSTTEKTYITDIAPTLAMLLNISFPSGAITGQPIKAIFE